ncbi:hypothetical protein [Reyranella sp.]|uniref:hypothetical protein n=1 Tax=Reyranella sp. TaxID=1929291 RepID=UPI003D0E40F9
MNDQLAVLDPVAHRHEATHPHAAPARGRDLIADALADHLALELGQGRSVLGWNGLLAPVGTLKPVIEKLNGEIVRILCKCEVPNQLKEQGVDVSVIGRMNSLRSYRLI